MEGQGVTNYAIDKPSYAFTTATTEFDDELIRRGIVSVEQAMVGKGASVTEAQRLAALKEGTPASSTETNRNNNHADNRSDDDEDSDDDEFLGQYRAQRIAEIKQEHDKNFETEHDLLTPRQCNAFGDVISIQRPDWTCEVNDASHNCWVVVTLTSSNVERTGPMEAAVTSLARLCPSIKFVTISSTSAISNWPDANLPSLFVYRGGTMVHEMVQLKPAIARSALALQQTLQQEAGVPFSDLEVEAVRRHHERLLEEFKEGRNHHVFSATTRRRVWGGDDEDEE